MRMSPLNFISLARQAALILAVTVTTSGAYAAGYENRGTPEQERACRPDVLRHCRGMSDTYAIEQCLRGHMQVLRPACRQVFGGGY
jgi:hypothetical protein